MSFKHLRFLLVGYLLLSALCLQPGCAWRSQEAEHYFGPVMYRHSDPQSGKAYLGEQIHFPFLLEGGDQWGVAIGLSRRLVASPNMIKKSGKRESDLSLWKWTKPLSFFSDSSGNEWNFSLIYLRGDGLKGSSLFSRSQFGGSVGIGEEARNISLGITKKVEIYPIHEGLYFLEYNSDRPNETRYEIWVDDFENISNIGKEGL